MYFKIIIFLLPLLIFNACSNTPNKVKLPKKCYEKGNTGKCRAYFIKYEYNKEKNKCEEFVFGGCGGNVPFNTLNECQKSCKE